MIDGDTSVDLRVSVTGALTAGLMDRCANRAESLFSPSPLRIEFRRRPAASSPTWVVPHGSPRNQR